MDDTIGLIPQAGAWTRATIAGEADRAWPPRATGLQQAPEIVRLFYALQALNTEARPLVLQVVSSVPGEGTSTVAAGLARVAAAERGIPVLLVDAAGQTSTSRPMLFGTSGSNAAWASPNDAGLYLARLDTRPETLGTFAAADLRRKLEPLQEQYPLIILDCPPVSASSDALALARCCDGTVLVVRAESSRRAVVGAAKDAVERFGGQVIGVVFNRRKMYIPSWLYRFL
jgi:protein-tyrosine kinase